MENNVIEQNKNKNLIIVVMSCIIVLLIAALVYFIFIKKEDKPVDNIEENNQAINDNTNKTNETDNFKPWMKYILEQNITKIELSDVPCIDDTYEKKTVTINVEQLKDIFNKFMNYKLRLSYIGGNGWDCGESLIIKYLKEGKEYELEYLGIEGHIVPIPDNNGLTDIDLENALYNSADEKFNENLKGQDGIFAAYDLIVDDYFFDEYFK